MRNSPVHLTPSNKKKCSSCGKWFANRIDRYFIMMHGKCKICKTKGGDINVKSQSRRFPNT